MLFYVHMEVSVPPDMPAELKERVRAAEHARAFELIKAGKLRRLWRPVTTADTCGIWEVESLDELHAEVRALPLYPYMKLSVTPLVEHPVTAAWNKERGPMPAF